MGKESDQGHLKENSRRINLLRYVARHVVGEPEDVGPAGSHSREPEPKVGAEFSIVLRKGGETGQQTANLRQSSFGEDEPRRSPQCHNASCGECCRTCALRL